MSPSADFLAHWQLHLPSLLVVALIYLQLIRALTALAFGWDGDSVPARILQGLTNPVLAVVGAITPRAVPRSGVLLLAIMWLFIILVGLVYAMTFMRVRPLWA